MCLVLLPDSDIRQHCSGTAVFALPCCSATFVICLGTLPLEGACERNNVIKNYQRAFSLYCFWCPFGAMCPSHGSVTKHVTDLA